MQVSCNELRTIKTQLWCAVIMVLMATVAEVMTLNGPNVCMVKQKYNITKRVKYRAPMSVRTYEWCFSMPPRCSRWNTEMRDLTKLETEERTAEVAVCCPGYKMKDVSCVPICPYGKTGPGCKDDCPENKWGPNCVNNCTSCALHGSCSPLTGECECEDGWQGESCEIRMSTTQATTTMMEELLKATISTTNTTPLPTTTSVGRTSVNIASTVSSTTVETTTVTIPLTSESSSSSISTTVTSPLSTASTTSMSVTTDKQSTTEISPSTKEPEIDKSTNKIIPDAMESTKPVPTSASIGVYDNVTTSTIISTFKSTVPETSTKVNHATTKSIYNRTDASLEMTTMPSVDLTSSFSTNSIVFTADTTKKTVLLENQRLTTARAMNALNITQLFTTSTEKEITTKSETTRKAETTLKTLSTVKFKPKEIWIKPTQKGESTVIDYKIKSNYELTHIRPRIATKKEITSEYTTPRTIIVSIIPTSVSYAIFKKIALTTSSYLSTKNASTKLNKTDNGFTSSMASHTPLPTFIKKALSVTTSTNTSHSTPAPITSKNQTKNESKSTKNETTKITLPVTRTTNSMTSMEANTSRTNSSYFLTTVPTSTNSAIISNISTILKLTKKPTVKPLKRNSIEATTKSLPTSTHNYNGSIFTVSNKSNFKATDIPLKKLTKTIEKPKAKAKNVTKIINNKNELTTVEPEDETFHILTEPEHITAVMSDKELDRSSMDLISVVSIAGGVMMAVIMVAVLIVMVERCRRPRYEDVRKVNDIRMQVMIDSNEAPPPYMRSIFHTPLPEPPPAEKCHYQPISTLDRNLKQFMRPVVVQNISPIMLENFRGILECHYDHLPRRNHDFGTMPSRFVTAPSVSYTQELRCQKSRSVTDAAIEALKCEAKLDVIDSTTSEPLYAEIPCWRPPSEHAIEVLNLNGEAITEL
ncbi:uncharacterized protein [Battus philenor]|uniref:uncharacterized protein n=1 Tax=Battus philenor TaxID=42288 RepID=UPI0035CE87A7